MGDEGDIEILAEIRARVICLSTDIKKYHSRCDPPQLTEPPNRVLSPTIILSQKGSLPPAVASPTIFTDRCPNADTSNEGQTKHAGD